MPVAAQTEKPSHAGTYLGLRVGEGTRGHLGAWLGHPPTPSVASNGIDDLDISKEKRACL